MAAAPLANPTPQAPAFALGQGRTTQYWICQSLQILTEVDNLQVVPPTGGEGETMVTP